MASKSEASRSSKPQERCFLLELPAELRLAIYHPVLEDHDLYRDSDTSKIYEEQQDHPHHQNCEQIWNNYHPTLWPRHQDHPNKWQIYGLPTREPIALLRTCRIIRFEATAELHKMVELKGEIYRCKLPRSISGESDDVITYRTFRNNAMRKVFRSTWLMIRIMEEKKIRSRWSRELDELPGFFPVLLDFWFIFVRKVEFYIPDRNQESLETSIRRLRTIAKRTCKRLQRAPYSDASRNTAQARSTSTET